MKTGRNIRAIRRQRGLTLDELSALCGVSRDDLGGYELGKVTPRPATVEKIAQALDVPIVAIREGMGWTAQEPLERWETGDGASLRDGVLEAVHQSRGKDFTPDETDIRLLMDSVKAAIPALVEHMKDSRPETEIHQDILAELGLCSADSGDDLLLKCRLPDDQWNEISPLLPPERTGKGRAFKSNRLMLDGILYHIKSGAAWKDLPPCFGRYKCVSDRLRLWQRTGVWEPVRAKLVELGVMDADSVKRNENG